MPRHSIQDVVRFADEKNRQRPLGREMKNFMVHGMPVQATADRQGVVLEGTEQTLREVARHFRNPLLQPDPSSRAGAWTLWVQ